MISELISSVSLQEVLQCSKSHKPETLVSVDPEDSLQNALLILGANRVTAAVVRSRESSLVSGMIDYLDILRFVRSKLDVALSSFQAYQHVRQILQSRVKEAVDKSRGDALLIANIHEFPAILVRFIAGGLAHRFIVSDEGKLEICSQSDILNFIVSDLENRFKDSEISKVMALPVSRCQNCYRDCVTVSKDTVMLDLISTLDSKQITSIALVDEHGRICGNFSASDLKGMTEINGEFLLTLVPSFLEKNSPQSLQPICVTPQTSIREAAEKMIQRRVHRIWLVDQGNRPVGVVTMTDILKEIFKI